MRLRASFASPPRQWRFTLLTVISGLLSGQGVMLLPIRGLPRASGEEDAGHLAEGGADRDGVEVAELGGDAAIAARDGRGRHTPAAPPQTEEQPQDAKHCGALLVEVELRVEESELKGVFSVIFICRNATYGMTNV